MKLWVIEWRVPGIGAIYYSVRNGQVTFTGDRLKAAAWKTTEEAEKYFAGFKEMNKTINVSNLFLVEHDFK